MARRRPDDLVHVSPVVDALLSARCDGQAKKTRRDSTPERAMSSIWASLAAVDLEA